MSCNLHYMAGMVPKQARIVSKVLCLDHTFMPDASDVIFHLGDYILLSKLPFIDKVYLDLNAGESWYDDGISCDRQAIMGWNDAAMFENAIDDSYESQVHDKYSEMSNEHRGTSRYTEGMNLGYKIHCSPRAIPRQARIVSEALCLDHTFIPAAGNTSFYIKDYVSLSKLPFVDKVYFYLHRGDAWYDDGINIEQQDADGWNDAALFDAVIDDISPEQNVRHEEK